MESSSTPPLDLHAAPTRLQVVVVGSLNMDLVATTARHPMPGETLSGQQFAQIAGGKGANQAVAAARLGASVAMVGCVGDDAYGAALVNGLAREGIAHDGVGTDAELPTGVALIVVDDAGQNSIVVIPGSNAAVTPAYVDQFESTIAGADVLVCQLETPLDSVKQALQHARHHGCATVLNVAPAQALPADIISLVDWLVVNEFEAEIMTGTPVRGVDDARLAARQLLDKGCGRVVITLGEHGVLLAEPGGAEHYPARRVTAVDTTGAGDTFIGGFVASLANGASHGDAVRFGQAAAAIAVTRAGAQTSIPSAAEVRAALA